MKNANLKRFGAFVLATSLVLGSSMVAFAGESGSATGTGDHTGHVDNKVVKVELPVISGNATQFAYTIDPENHIGKTGKSKNGTSISANASRVYFANVSGNATSYSATSDTVTVTNKSNADIVLTVSATVAANAKNIALAASSTAVDSATDPSLYLGLKVGNTETAIVANTGATKTVSMNGTDNYEETYDTTTNKYKMVEKASPAAWTTIAIGLTGKVSNKTIADDLVAPNVTLTWSWTDPAATPTDAAPTISAATFTKASPADVVITYTLGTGSKAEDADATVTLAQSTNKTPVNVAKYSVDKTAKTITIDKSAGFLTGATADVPIYVTIGDTEVSGTITIK